VMANPNGALDLQCVHELDHVLDDLALRICRVARVCSRRAAIAAHIRRDAAEAERRKRRQLVPPADRKLWPAVQEEDRRALLCSSSEEESAVTRCLDDVLGDV